MAGYKNTRVKFSSEWGMTPYYPYRCYKGVSWKFTFNGAKLYFVLFKNKSFAGLHPLPSELMLGKKDSNKCRDYIIMYIEEYLKLNGV